MVSKGNGIVRRMFVAVALVVATVTAVPALTSSPAEARAQATTFTDVPAGHAFATEIGWLVAEGITTGFADGSFRPTASVTRQATAAFLFRFANRGATAEPCTAKPFSDVLVSHPFCGEIAWLAETGITTGFSDGTFGGGGPVTRQAMASFMSRFAVASGQIAPCAGAAFVDVPRGHQFCGAISWLTTERLSSGFTDGSFRPTAVLSRQAMAAFLYRLDGFGPGVNELASETRVVDEADVVFEDLDRDGTTVLSYDGATVLRRGDVVVTMAPDGPYYGRVTTVSGDQVVTEAATLMDVVPDLDLALDVDAETGAASIAAPAGGEPITVEDVPQQERSFGAAAPTTSGSCSGSATGTVEAEVIVDAGRFELNAKWNALRGPEKLEVLYAPTFTANFHAGLQVSGTCTYHVDLFDMALPAIRFSIGPVPVWITHNIAADLDAKAEAHGAVSIDAGFTAQGRLGARWENGEFNLINEFTRNKTLDPSLTVGASASVDVPVTYGARAYGILGFAAAAGPFAELDVDPFATPWLTLDAGLKGSISAVFELKAGPIKFHKSHTFGPWELARWRLYDTGTGDGASWPGPKITTTSLPDVTIGVPYSATLTATGGSGPLTWFAIGLPPGVVINPTTGSISGSPSCVGAEPATIGVSDAEGYTSTRDFVIGLTEPHPDAICNLVIWAVPTPSTARPAIGAPDLRRHPDGGVVYRSGSNLERVVWLRDDGSHTVLFESTGPIWILEVGSDGAVYYSVDRRTIQARWPDGSTTEVFDKGSFTGSQLTNIVWGQDGDLYAAVGHEGGPSIVNVSAQNREEHWESPTPWMSRSTNFVVSADGTIYLPKVSCSWTSCHDHRQIVAGRYDPQLGWIESIVAGTGAPGAEGDGGPAEQAALGDGITIALAADGALLVIQSPEQGRVPAKVRRIHAGTIETVAGTGTPGWTGDGGDARFAQIRVWGLAPAEGRSFYVLQASEQGFAVRKVGSPQP